MQQPNLYCYRDSDYFIKSGNYHTCCLKNLSFQFLVHSLCRTLLLFTLDPAPQTRCLQSYYKLKDQFYYNGDGYKFYDDKSDFDSFRFCQSMECINAICVIYQKRTRTRTRLRSPSVQFIVQRITSFRYSNFHFV